MHKLTRQEALDKVCRHLKKQRKRAFDNHFRVCVFRTSEGNMCAIGCLAPEHIYDSGTSMGVNHLGHLGIGFLSALREAHDKAFDNKFKARLKAVAHRFDLKWRHG